jgi:hypothetical protein
MEARGGILGPIAEHPPMSRETAKRKRGIKKGLMVQHTRITAMDNDLDWRSIYHLP